MGKAKNLLSIFAHSNRTCNVSINYVAEQVYSILRELSEVDSIFLHPTHYNGSKETRLNLNDSSIEDIAKLILNSEWNEITKHEGVKKPTLEYIRVESGFSFNAKYSQEDQDAFHISIGIGYQVDGISISNFNKSVEFDFNWYKEVLYKVVQSFKPFFATVKLSNQPSNIFYNEMNIKYPIGWITYFSDAYDICIPDDLEEVRYEFVKDGKFLYTSDEDFMKDKEAYFGNREKLQRIITELKDRVPEFIKSDKEPTA